MDTQGSLCQFLQNYAGRKIRVCLKDSRCYEGLLASTERREREKLGNILLRDAKKVNYEEKFDWLLIRGNNVLIIYFVEI
jgi:small nuclear ribonucleoprotein (snRNP)-like protein